MTDLSLKIDGVRLNFRVGAIIIRSGKYLICRLPGKNWSFMPGGRVKLNESTEQAIRRELQEELGNCWVLGKVRIFSENFFELEGEYFHEICHYYKVFWQGDDEITKEMEEAEEEFEWIDLDDFPKYNVFPEFLYEALKNTDDDFIHHINK